MRRRTWMIHTVAWLPLAAARAAPVMTQRHLRFTMQISNPASHALVQQTICMYAPMRKTGTQELLDVRVSAPHELVFDALGQSVITLHLPHVAPLSTRVVSLTARLALRHQAMDEQLADASAWLGEQRYVEISDAAIRTLADELRRDGQLAMAKAIYDWVRLNIIYDRYRAEDVGAREALRSRRGDCTEYAYLCAALARLNGIPARVVGGYVSYVDAAPRAADYHNWAQFHLLGAWRTVDAQRQQWWDDGAYVAFHVVVDDSSLNVLGLARRFTASQPLKVAM
jgi:Transglutaminase-like superfamily